MMKPLSHDSLMHGLQREEFSNEPVMLSVLNERRQRRMEKRRDILLLAMTLGLEEPDRTRKMYLLQTWVLNGDLLEDEWNEVKRIGRSA